MITRMMHLATLCRIYIYDAAFRKECTTAYKIDNRIVYNILDQICMDIGLYLYVRQYKSKRDGRGSFFVIHTRRLVPNLVNTTASEAEAALLTFAYDGKKKAWNQERYVPYHVK